MVSEDIGGGLDLRDEEDETRGRVVVGAVATGHEREVIRVAAEVGRVNRATKSGIGIERSFREDFATRDGVGFGFSVDFDG